MSDLTSRFTGLFRAIGPVPRRAHDPDVAVWAGTPAHRPWPADDAVGGAGWTDDAAERACIGEAIERWQTHALARDPIVQGSFARWSHDEPAIDPARFVRFHRDQHAQPGFPYEALDAHTETAWVRCRLLASGEPVWAPAELTFLDLRPEARARFGPTISTGWSAHATFEAALRAAVLELVERDAVVGAWWGRYPLVELDGAAVLGATMERLARANLTWRWFRIVSPYAAHVTLATLAGEDREGHVFSIGSACRLDARASLEKAALEAVQGRHYVRYLLATATATAVPTTFAEHAAFYSHHPERLRDTCLATATRGDVLGAESFAAIVARLPPLAFRLATPPGLVGRGYTVVRVLAPELQPLHGDHRFPFLGGPAWNRPVAEWAQMPPHPFA